MIHNSAELCGVYIAVYTCIIIWLYINHGKGSKKLKAITLIHSIA